VAVVTTIVPPAERFASTRPGTPRAAIVVSLVVLLTLMASTQRLHRDGPLDENDGGAGVVVDAFAAGSDVTYGLVTLTSSGDEEITITALEPLPGDPSLEVFDDLRVTGPERLSRGFNSFDVEQGWPPPHGSRAGPGATIAPDGGIGLEALVPVRVPSAADGIGVLEGVRVSYTAGGYSYTEDVRVRLVLCPTEQNAACIAYDP